MSNQLFRSYIAIVLFSIIYLTGYTQTIIKNKPHLIENHSKSLTITHLIGDYYIFTTYQLFKGVKYPANGMYVVTTNGVVLIDTPWDQTQCQPLLDSIATRHHKKVILAIATHYHDDRTGGFDFLKQQGVKTYTSKLTYDLCKERNEKQSEFYFTRDTTFKVGNHTFQTYYPGEGHTKDNLVVWCKNKRVLYAGCLAKSIENDGLGNVADSNLEAWPISIKKVLKKYPKPAYVIPGHFNWKSNKGLQHTLNLLQLHELKPNK